MGFAANFHTLEKGPTISTSSTERCATKRGQFLTHPPRHLTRPLLIVWGGAPLFGAGAAEPLSSWLSEGSLFIRLKPLNPLYYSKLSRRFAVMAA